MDFAADADYQSITAEAGKLAASFDDDYWLEHDDKKQFPWAFYNAFAAAGWVGVLIPEQYGGAGLTTEERYLLERVVSIGLERDPPAVRREHGSVGAQVGGDALDLGGIDLSNGAQVEAIGRLEQQTCPVG